MTMSARSRWSFLPSLLLFAAVCSLLVGMVLHVLSIPFGAPLIGGIVYLFMISAVLHFWQGSALASDPNAFVRRAMAALVIKMMITLLVLLVVLLNLPRPDILPFAVPFILLYLAFLGFSTARTTRLLHGRTRS